MQAHPMRPEEPLSATLEAQEWNFVFSALDERMRASRAIFDKLMGQIQQQVPAAQQPVNGEARTYDSRKEA